MPTSLYNFQYVPLTGRLPGKSFVSQTEQAINGLAQYVYDNSTNYEAVKAIAQKAEEDSSTALEYSEQALDKAQTALETVGRAYIKTTSAVDLNDYFDSELLLILSTESTNLPANISGYLTVMSSDTNDYCMQVYIGIDGSVYKRTATISDNTPTFGAWSETPITMSSLQTILADYAKVNASNVGVNAQTDNSVAWGNAIGGGEIASGEQRLITGGTVYPLSVDVDIADKRITNIEKLLQGNLYDYQTDSTNGYTKTVPSGALPYAGLEKVGGKTIVWNQAIHDPTMTDATKWRSLFNSAQFSSSVSNNVLRFERANSNTFICLIVNNGDRTLVTIGHKYFFRATVRFSTDTPFRFIAQDWYAEFGGTTSWQTYKAIATATGTPNVYMALGIRIGGDVMPYGEYVEVKDFNCIDLTILYGSGNEPTTTAEVESMFPASVYSYNAGTLLSAGVTSVVSKDSNNATLQTYSIPAEVQALEGYGWSAGTAYNYVDFERKKFVKNVVAYQFTGNEDKNFYTSDSSRFYFYILSIFAKGLANRQIVTDKLTVANTQAPINMGDYETFVNANPTYSNFMYIALPYSIKAGLSESSTTAEKLAAGMEWLANNNVKMYYQLNTPTETDISQYLTDDNLINVEADGTITFPNSNGDDYRLPVPSEEEYMIDLQSALGD